MARETKAERLAREEKAALEAHEQHLEFIEKLPATLYELQKRASELGMYVQTHIAQNGFIVEFSDRAKDIDFTINTAIVEEWEVEALESYLNRLQAEADLQKKKLELATNAWTSLTKEQQDAIRETKIWDSRLNLFK